MGMFFPCDFYDCFQWDLESEVQGDPSLSMGAPAFSSTQRLCQAHSEWNALDDGKAV